MPFGVNPNEGGAEATPEDFGTYIQFQQDGTDLGLPNIRTVDFSTGVTATRGTGANANKLTVTAAGGEGGSEAPTLVLNLQQGVATPSFAGSDYTAWDGTERVASADAEWVPGVEGGGEIIFARTGLYEVFVHAYIEAADGSWPTANDETLYGSHVSGAENIDRSVHARRSDLPGLGNAPPRAVFMDRYLFNVSDIEVDALTPALYARAYSNNTDECGMLATVTVKRISDPILEA